MKIWNTPKAEVEQFSANEYVAACWYVGCNTSEANAIEKTLRNDPTGGHRAQYCGNPTHQAINDVGTKMVETGTF